MANATLMEQPVTVRTTRATIRFAQAHEGPVIQALCAAKGEKIADWLDWTVPLAQNWLIAETDHPIACIMVNYGVPVGRMSFLIVPPGLPHRLQALAVRDLCYAAFEALSRHGSQVVASMTSDADPHWSNVVCRRGAVAFDTGTLYLKRL